SLLVCYFFFFQAEDGIRDRNVTGVQTCALPISSDWQPVEVSACTKASTLTPLFFLNASSTFCGSTGLPHSSLTTIGTPPMRSTRSEERRVGKECRSGWAADH